jgi:hypothetical protein
VARCTAHSPGRAQRGRTRRRRRRQRPRCTGRPTPACPHRTPRAVVGESRAAAAAVPGEVGGDSRAVPSKSRAVAGESRTAAAVLCSMGFGGRIVDWTQETAVGRGGGDLEKKCNYHC